MLRVLQLLSILLGLSLSAPDTASPQSSKGGSVPPSPAAVAIGRSDFESNCAACHPSASGQNGYGPGLFGVVGRRSGTATGYVYSPSYVEAGAKGVTWTGGPLTGNPGRHGPVRALEAIFSGFPLILRRSSPRKKDTLQLRG